jgi:Xaa-Pro dipeptidase
MVRPISQVVSAAEIGVDELRGRVARIQAAMGEQGFGALVLFGDATRSSNLKYVFDFQPIDGVSDISIGVVIIPADGEPTAFASEMNLLWAQEVAWFEALPFSELPARLVALGANLPAPRVGVAGLGLMPVAVYETIRGAFALSTVSVVPAEPLLAPIKARKSPAELELLRAAGLLIPVYLDAVRDAVQGSAETEREVAAAATIAIIQAGGDKPAMDIQIQSGVHSSYNNMRSTSRRIQPGDSIMIEGGTKYRGYVTDIARGATVGEVDPEQLKIIEVAAAALEEGCQALRPGMTAGELNSVIEQSLIDAGYVEYSAEARGYGTGHGIGTDIEEEEPWIRPGSSFVLEENMTMALKASIFLPGVAGVRVEDNLVVTPEGGQVYTIYPRVLQW